MFTGLVALLHAPLVVSKKALTGVQFVEPAATVPQSQDPGAYASSKVEGWAYGATQFWLPVAQTHTLVLKGTQTSLGFGHETVGETAHTESTMGFTPPHCADTPQAGSELTSPAARTRADPAPGIANDVHTLLEIIST
jgi:hypothetical protein